MTIGNTSGVTPKVFVMSRARIEELVREEGLALLERANVISCLDTGLASPFIYSVYRDHHPNLFTMHFDDVGNEDWDHTDEPWKYQVFSKTHAVRLKAWFDSSNKELPYFVHCWAGVSRSSAIGIWLNRQLGIPDTELFDRHPKIKPNKIVLEVLRRLR